MADVKIKRIDKEQSKENFNSNMSQLVVELEEAATNDWREMFNSGWMKTPLGAAAKEAICSGSVIIVRYNKGAGVSDITKVIEQALAEVNKSQDAFNSQIDAENERFRKKQ